MQVNPQALRVIRERSGYTVRGLAKAAEVSHASITRIEQGSQNPSPPIVKRLAQALDVPLVALLSDEEVAV